MATLDGGGLVDEGIDVPSAAMSSEATAAWESLDDLLCNMPIPAAPPRYPSVGVLVGVSLLDLALNLNHLARRSEKLVTVDRAQLGREVSVRVSLDRLTPEQHEAGLVYGRLRDSAGFGETATDRASRTSARSIVAELPDERPPLIWVPVARVSRRVTAPVRVFDNEGREVPRATQPELLPIVNAALLTLLHLILRSEADADVWGTHVHRLLHRWDRARWLLQGAISEMVQGTRLFARRGASTPPEPSSDVRKIRALARSVAKQCLRPDSAFLELLYQASLEYLVVVGLTSSKKEHYLSWEAPTLPAVGDSAMRSGWRRLGRGLFPVGREFVLEYTTYLPRRLDSFHVMVEAEPGVRVREAVLTTQHDRLRAESLVSAFKELDEFARTGRSAGVARPFFEYEVSDAFARLDDLIARRTEEWAWCETPDGTRSTADTPTGDQPPEARHVDTADAPGLRHPDALSLRETAVSLRQSDYAAHVGVAPCTPDELAKVSDLVDGLDLGSDLVSDDDPREHAAHLYWRQNRRRRIAGSPTTPRASVHVVFSDDAPALINSVLGWLTGLCVLVAIIGVLLFGLSSWPIPWIEIGFAPQRGIQVDALVAVLLIAPTAIFSRLDLPGTNTIAGQLRILDRVLGYLAILLAGSLGLVLAARTGPGENPHAPFAVVFLGLLVLLVAAVVDVLLSHAKRQDRRLLILDIPAWARSGGETPRRPDAIFSSLPPLAWGAEAQQRSEATDGS